jgi:Domain of unknown function (DUF4440)
VPGIPESQRDEIAEAYQAYLDAMHHGDTATLDELLDEAFTLIHITGYVQPKAEWLAEIRAGQFAYHAIRQYDLTVDHNGNTARLVARTVTDATVTGTAPTGDFYSQWTTGATATRGERCEPPATTW